MEAFLIAILVTCLIFSWVCAGMAERRGRSKAKGAVVGFFLGIWGVIAYFIAGDSEEKRVERIRKAMRD